VEFSSFPFAADIFTSVSFGALIGFPFLSSNCRVMTDFVVPLATMLAGSAVILNCAGAGGFFGLFNNMKPKTADATPIPATAPPTTHNEIPSSGGGVGEGVGEAVGVGEGEGVGVGVGAGVGEGVGVGVDVVPLLEVVPVEEGALTVSDTVLDLMVLPSESVTLQ